MAQDKVTVTGQQAADAQTALRKVLGLAPERFPLPAFVGMVSDEIEQLREKGRSDEEIAGLIRDAVDVELTGDDVARFYATPEERGHHG